MSAVTLLIATAPSCGFEASLVEPGLAQVYVPLPRASGTTVDYHLVLEDSGNGHVQVREQPDNRRLPQSCCERHINADGSFCLYWRDSPTETRAVVDADTALDWWRVLIEYLRRQELATRFGKWFGEARAHGDAARFQARAEQIALKFGKQFSRDLRDGVLYVRRRARHGRQVLQLSRGATMIARVSPKSNGMIAAQVRCPCDAAAPTAKIADCGSHRAELKDFIIALDQWQERERRFYEYLRTHRVRCCGTMELCPLRE